LATSPIYFFFFFAAFLAFLFFAITSLHQRLKKQAQRPSYLAAGDSTVGTNPPANPCRSVYRATEKSTFHRVDLAASARFESQRQKIFSSIAHNRQSSKKYFAKNFRFDRVGIAI